MEKLAIQIVAGLIVSVLLILIKDVFVKLLVEPYMKYKAEVGRLRGMLLFFKPYIDICEKAGKTKEDKKLLIEKSQEIRLLAADLLATYQALNFKRRLQKRGKIPVKDEIEQALFHIISLSELLASYKATPRLWQEHYEGLLNILLDE